MARPKPFTAAPGGPDMSRDEAFERVLHLARAAQEGMPVVPGDRRDLQAIKLIESLAVGSHSYKPEVKR